MRLTEKRCPRVSGAASACPGAATSAGQLLLGLGVLALGLDQLALGRRALALGPAAAEPAPAGALLDRLALVFDQFQLQPAGHWCGLGQLDGDALTGLYDHATIGPHQGRAFAVEMEIFAAQGPDRDQPVGAGFIQPHKGAESRDTADPPGQFGADPFRQVGGEVAVGRVAFGGHGAPLGFRDMGGDMFQIGDLVGVQPVLAPAM